LELAAKLIYPHEVEWAIKTFEPYEAPGIDGIYPILLQVGLGILLDPLTKVCRTSIALRYVLQAWRATTVVFIPQPGKNSHNKAKDRRFISLKSFLPKTLERLGDTFLKNGSFKHPLAAAQYAYKEGRSTDTALHQLISKVEVHVDAKGYALGSFLDIKGAFHSTSMEGIK
jgi:hypothetical protein